ncbi:membrane protein [Leminorella grimontii]|uniref:Membrane protein n=2 Tax=Leminorella grimontii TaxID=82981 RepID=A0AAV5N943_9GAMM|nr:putative transmembrane protein [Leminorella grimontii ATCC 33999 = DSM 5078]GKX56927.1 membrane protein [Leminorella grimontii]VFS61173.1 Uncharacterised protein [Leminorella grimontii]
MKAWLKMKAVKYGLWAAAVGLLATLPASAEEPALTPQDFYQGAQLSTPASAPFYRLSLPDRVYSETAWSDLRDVRVFNHTGQAVTFTLEPLSLEKTERYELSLKVFPLQATANKANENGSEGKVVLKSADGIEVTLRPGAEQRAMGVTYLLKADGAQPPREGDGFEQITLDWNKSAANWQAKVSVYGSRDLKNWRPRATDAPLMDLLSGDDRLLLNHIDIDNNYSSRDDRYWLVVVNAEGQNALPTLNKAQAVSVIKHSDAQTLDVPFGVEKASKNEVVYQLKHPQPLSTLSVVPAQNNTVLPVSIEYRSTAEGEWRPLAHAAIYRLESADGYRISDSLPLNKMMVQSVRIKAVSGSWGEAPPEVKGERERVEVIFNAQGNPPYLLTWGAKIAPSASVEIGTLIPYTVMPKSGIESLYTAEVGPTVTLGGESRLTAESAAEASARWQTWLLWGLLIAGVAGLGVITLKLVREATGKRRD